jgi:hypothetical protein
MLELEMWLLELNVRGVLDGYFMGKLWEVRKKG